MKNKIVLVSFSFDDFSGTKVRPAVCLTDAISSYNHVIVAFITSKIDIAIENSDLLFLSSDIDFNQTGLKVDSVLRLHRLITIPSHIIKRELGVLPTSYQKNIKLKIKDIFQI